MFNIEIEEDLKDLIPTYLANLEQNLQKILDAVAKEDLETARQIGHNMKGSGGGYGFHEVSRRGREIEEAAKAQDSSSVGSVVQELRDYLQRITITYI